MGSIWITALGTTQLKRKCWFRYVNNTFIVWQHGLDIIKEPLGHLNNMDDSIKFTMEIEINGKLPFLDVMVTRKDDAALRPQKSSAHGPLPETVQLNFQEYRQQSCRTTESYLATLQWTEKDT